MEEVRKWNISTVVRRNPYPDRKMIRELGLPYLRGGADGGGKKKSVGKGDFEQKGEEI